MNRLASGDPARPPAERRRPRPAAVAAAGSAAGSPTCALTRDGRTLYFQEGDGGLQHDRRRRRRRRRWRRRRRRPAAAAAAAAAAGWPRPLAAAAAGGGGGGAKRRITFNVTVKIDKPGEWDEMFDDAWRTMKYRFYDPKMHGKDWDAMRAKYKPLVAYVGDRHELMNVINEMIGELNASHTGASAGGGGRRRGRAGAVDPAPRPRPRARRRRPAATRSPTSTRTGPPTRTGSRSSKGNYLIAIDGKPLKAGDDYCELPRPPAQPQGRADPQRQARGRRGVEGQVRADLAWPPSPTSATSAG